MMSAINDYSRKKYPPHLKLMQSEEVTEPGLPNFISQNAMLRPEEGQIWRDKSQDESTTFGEVEVLEANLISVKFRMLGVDGEDKETGLVLYLEADKFANEFEKVLT